MAVDIYQGDTAIYGGMAEPGGGGGTPPEGLPLWASSSPLNAWMEIPNTAIFGSITDVRGYSGWALLPNGKLAIALAGGHTDGFRNNVVVADMIAASPVITQVHAGSPEYAWELAYAPDGLPTSCHTYQTLSWVPATNRLMRFGSYGVHGGGNTNFPEQVDGFNFDTNSWDPAGTWDVVGAGPGTSLSGAALNPITSQELLNGGGYFYTPLTGALQAITGYSGARPRNGYTWDSNRQMLFGMCYGDNQEASLGLGLVAVKIVNAVATQITFTGSEALSLIATEIPYYAGTTYDSVNDCYYWYSGVTKRVAEARGRVYKITPNNTNVWSIEVFSYGDGGVLPVATLHSGLQNKFTYIPELKGVVMMPQPMDTANPSGRNMYYMRTSN